MDKQNKEDVLRLASDDDHRRKVKLFLLDDIVPDPYFDDNMFEPVFHMVKERCEQLVVELKNSI